MFLLFITLFGQFKLEKCFSYLTSSSQNLLLLNVTAFAFRLLFFFFYIWTHSSFFLSFLFFLSFFLMHTVTQTHTADLPLIKWASAYVKLLFFGHIGKDGIKERQNCYGEYHLPRRLKISRKITLQVEGKTAEKPRNIWETFWNDVKVWLLRSYCSIFRNHQKLSASTGCQSTIASLLLLTKKKEGKEKEWKKVKLFLVYGKCWVLLAYEKK